MDLWKKVALIYPISALTVTTLYTLETLSVNRTEPSADSLVFIVFILLGVPSTFMMGLLIAVLCALKKRKDLALGGAALMMALPGGLISGVFLTGFVVKMLV